ncbi:probable serine/threonine-protein kinase mkcC isoform X2 [Pristis pectinata]|uniref:probable serine/threonine-protein kinase mkcC isoform X2 n=1 Tax=Pristis pectinata TaxID=685728 RepID=UPI00223E022A|nr:probable serine/threonine-protein kinase mkcC isoform X2 [Pristis pectinata]
MQSKHWSLAFYLLFILCNVLLVIDVNAMMRNVSTTTDSNGNISTSHESLKATTNNSSMVRGSNESEPIFVPQSNQNTTSNSTTTLASGTTVAMSTSGPDSSRASVTPTVPVQTTALSNVSSHSTTKSSATPTLNSTATDSQVTTIATSVPKPTQTEATVTSRKSSNTAVTQPTTDSLYSIITTATSGSVLPLKKEEVILTICLSTVLAVVILTIVMYNVNKCKRRRAQYSHHPLYANSHEDPGKFKGSEGTSAPVSGKGVWSRGPGEPEGVLTWFSKRHLSNFRRSLR